MSTVNERKTRSRRRRIQSQKAKQPGRQTARRSGSQAARHGVKILSDQVHIIGLVNIHSFLRYSEG